MPVSVVMAMASMGFWENFLLATSNLVISCGWHTYQIYSVGTTSCKGTRRLNFLKLWPGQQINWKIPFVKKLLHYQRRGFSGCCWTVAWGFRKLKISRWTIYRVTPPPKKNRTHKRFITSTKIKQNNSNFVHSNFWTCWWILWPQFSLQRIYFISWKKKARIEFMNFSQKSMGSAFWGSPCNL